MFNRHTIWEHASRKTAIVFPRCQREAHNDGTPQPVETSRERSHSNRATLTKIWVVSLDWRIKRSVKEINHLQSSLSTSIINQRISPRVGWNEEQRETSIKLNRRKNSGRKPAKMMLRKPSLPGGKSRRRRCKSATASQSQSPKIGSLCRKKPSAIRKKIALSLPCKRF